MTLKIMAGRSTYEIIMELGTGNTVVVGRKEIGPVFAHKAPGNWFNKPLRTALTFKPLGGHLFEIIVKDMAFVQQQINDMNFDWDSLDW